MTIIKVIDMTSQKLKEHMIDRDWCKGCGICVYFCPKKVLELDDMDKVAAVRSKKRLHMLQAL